jgi:hypothetical protein
MVTPYFETALAQLRALDIPGKPAVITCGNL